MTDIGAKENVQQIRKTSAPAEGLLTECIPNLIKKYIQPGETREQFNGTRLKITLDISGNTYSYVIKNGVHVAVKEGDIDTPLVRISLSQESMAKLIDWGKNDLLIWLQKHLTRKNCDLMSQLSGTVVFQIQNSDGTLSEIIATFNAAENPKTIMRLSLEDARLIGSGKESFFNLLVSGKMKIDGRITFAVTLQPLFAA